MPRPSWESLIPINPKDPLAESRVLLRKFEEKMEAPEGIIYLSEALSMLADAATDSLSAELKQMCLQMVSAYAIRVQEKVQPLLTQGSTVDEETIDHWLKVFSEFKDSDLALPSQFTECHSKLHYKKFLLILDQMSPSERERSLKLFNEVLEREIKRTIPDMASEDVQAALQKKLRAVLRYRP